MSLTQALVEGKQADVDARNTDGGTPLQLAASAGRSEELEYLVLLGADVNARDHKGGTALMAAAKGGHHKSVTQLLSHAANPTLASNDGFTALHIACIAGHTMVAMVLLQHSRALVTSQDATGATPAFWSAALGHLNTLQVLLRFGASATTGNKSGHTPLMAAAEKGHVDVVQYLQGVVDVDVTEHQQGATALFLACRNGHTQCVRCLIKAGANINVKERLQHFTPLHIAAWNGHADVVDVLLGCLDLDVCCYTGMGLSVLDVAASRGHCSVLELLLEFLGEAQHTDTAMQFSTAQPPASKASAHTACLEAAKRTVLAGASWSDAAVQVIRSHISIALLQAASEAQPAAAETLLGYGADPNFRDQGNHGSTPLLLAATAKAADVMKLLLSRGAQPNVADTKHMLTPLMVSAAAGSVECVKLLLGNGAAVDQKNKHGSTALLLACEGGHVGVVKVLLAFGADSGVQDDNGATILIKSCLLDTAAPLVKLIVSLCPHKQALADVQAVDGTTALMVASERGQLAAVQCLVEEAGATVSTVDSSGDTALVIAKRRAGNHEVVSFLTKHTMNDGSHAVSSIDLHATAHANKFKVVQVAGSSKPSTQPTPLAQLRGQRSLNDVGRALSMSTPASRSTYKLVHADTSQPVEAPRSRVDRLRHESKLWASTGSPGTEVAEGDLVVAPLPGTPVETGPVWSIGDDLAGLMEAEHAAAATAGAAGGDSKELKQPRLHDTPSDAVDVPALKQRTWRAKVMGFLSLLRGKKKTRPTSIPSKYVMHENE